MGVGVFENCLVGGIHLMEMGDEIFLSISITLAFRKF